MTESPGDHESGLRYWSRTFPAREKSVGSVVLCLVIGDICFPYRRWMHFLYQGSLLIHSVGAQFEPFSDHLSRGFDRSYFSLRCPRLSTLRAFGPPRLLLRMRLFRRMCPEYHRLPRPLSSSSSSSLESRKPPSNSRLNLLSPSVSESTVTSFLPLITPSDRLSNPSSSSSSPSKLLELARRFERPTRV